MSLLIFSFTSVFLGSKAFAERVDPARFLDVRFEAQMSEMRKGIRPLLPRRVSHAIVVGLNTFVLTEFGIYRVDSRPEGYRIGKSIIPCKYNELTALSANSNGRTASFASTEGHIFDVDLLAAEPTRTVRQR